MTLPQMHGRTHVPAGYAAVVQVSDGTDHLAQASSDQIPSVLSSSSAGITWAAGRQQNSQTLTTATPLIINFAASWIDGTTTGGVDTSSATFRIFDSDLDGSFLDAIGFYRTGVYYMEAHGKWQTGTYDRVLELQGFGSDLGLGDTRFTDAAQGINATYGPTVSYTLILDTLGGDTTGTGNYVRVTATQTSGSNKTIDDIVLKVMRLGDY